MSDPTPDTPPDRQGGFVHLSATVRLPVVAAVAAVTAICFASRLLIAVTSPWGFNADEAATGVMAQQILEGHNYLFFAGSDYMGSLPEYARGALLAVLPDEVWSLRLLDVLLSCATCVVVYAIGRRVLGGHGVALLAAGIYAIWPLHNLAWGATTQPQYSPSQLLAAVGLLVALRSPGRRPLLTAFGFGVVFGLTAWLQPVGYLVTIPAAIWLLGSYCGRLRGAAPVLAAGALIGASPLIVHRLMHPEVGLSGAPEMPVTTLAQRADNVFDQLVAMGLGLTNWRAGTDLAGWLPAQLLAVALLGALAVACWIRRRGLLDLVTLRTARRRPIDCLLAAIVFGLLMLTVSKAAYYTGDPRYLYVLYPSLAVLVAALLTVPRRRPWAYAVAGLLVMGALSAAPLVKDIRDRPDLGLTVLPTGQFFEMDDFASAARQLQRLGVDGAFADYWIAYPVQYFAGDAVAVEAFAPSRFAHLGRRARRAENAAFVVPSGVEAKRVSGLLGASGASFRTTEVGSLVILDRISPRRTPEDLGIIPRGG